MKIGIFTFHRATNVGANLQAYAFQKHLTDNGYKTEIIDFVPNSDCKKNSFAKKVLHAIKRILYSNIKKQDKKNIIYSDFRKQYMVLSDTTYFGDIEIMNAKLDYDILISGSDQILNLDLSNNSLAYYLPFNGVKKISYASSFGKNQLSIQEKAAIKKYLSRFDFISFRENSGYDLANAIINIPNKNIVVDPVFFLSKLDWLKIAKPLNSEPFIFVYMMENTFAIRKTIIQLHNEYPTRKIQILFGSRIKLNLGFKYKELSDVGPLEFLSLINNSDIVITNSFHGLSFSLIFEKKVYCCAHTTRNARIENLLRIINQENKIIKNDSNIFIPVDLNYNSKNLKSIIEYSKKYISDALKTSK